jgi:hypothetical protein
VETTAYEEESICDLGDGAGQTEMEFRPGKLRMRLIKRILYEVTVTL